MGSDKGGSADQSGMMEAMASAQASQQAYALGEQQLQWTQQVWNQEQPLVDQSEQEQISLAQQQQASLAQSQAESQAQWEQYQQYYAPLEATFVNQAENWASPQAMATARAQAMASVGEQGMQGVNTAAETLRSYGINPGSARYASLFTGAQPMIGASEAAAGTTAAQNLRAQQMELESNAINTGRGLVNATGSLTQAGTSAGSAASGSAAGAGNTAQENLSTGSTAMTAPSQWFNAGTNAMNSYVGAVNGYNNSQAAFNEAGAQEMGGLGSALGSIVGLGAMKGIAKGGPITRYAYGGPAVPPIPGMSPVPGTPSSYQMTPDQGGGPTGIPSSPMMPRQTYAGGGDAGATPGGTVPIHASPSGGVATDDVPAMLTAHEFVIPKDVAVWKGHQYFAGQIDKARQEQQRFAGRDDVGGEPTSAIPQQPTFVSRPPHAHNMGGAIPAYPG
jgi:hypothetical protein